MSNGMGFAPPDTTDEQPASAVPEPVKAQPLTGVGLVFGRMIAVMNEVREIAKDGRYEAPGTKYNFRGVDAVVNAVGPALRKHGLVPAVELRKIERRDTHTSRDKATRETTVEVVYRLICADDGSMVEYVIPGEALDTSDKGTAKAMSVAYRIFWLQALCIPTDDPDPDASHLDRTGTGPMSAALVDYLVPRVRELKLTVQDGDPATAVRWAAGVQQLGELWGIVLGYGAAEQVCPLDKGRTWHQLFAERWRAEINYVRNPAEGRALWEAAGVDGRTFRMEGSDVGDLVTKQVRDRTVTSGTLVRSAQNKGIAATTLAGVQEARADLDRAVEARLAFGDEVDKAYEAFEERDGAIRRGYCQQAGMEELHDAFAVLVEQATDPEQLDALAAEIELSTGHAFDLETADTLRAKVQLRTERGWGP